jgi:hypothetical protein
VHYSGSSSGAAARGSATQQQQAPELAGEHSEQQQHQQRSSSGNNNSSSSSSGATLAEAAVLRRLRAAAVDDLSPEEALIELQELQNSLPTPTATDTTAIDTTATTGTNTAAAAAMATSIGTAVPGCGGLKRLSSAQHLAGHVVVLGFPPRPSHMECFLRPLVQHRRHRPALVFVSAALAPLEAAFGRLVRTTGDELDLSDVYVLEVHSR